MPARTLGVLLALTSISAWADPAIILFPSVGKGEQVTVAGRVLKEAPTSGSSTFSKNLRRLAAPNWEGAEVEVAFAGQKASTKSGHDGAFEVSFSAPKDKPFTIGLEIAEAHVPGAIAKTAVDVISPDAPFFVISDFDDTVAVTNVIDARGLVSSALFKDSDTQPVVAGMSDFYRCLRSDKKANPAFALVSGSPVQYVPRTMAFLKRYDFPFMGLYLRDLGPNTMSGYKQPHIRQLLKTLPQEVVLIGDSGEHDPEVYAEMNKEFPGRVTKIFIRDAGKTEVATRFEGMTLFKTAKDAAAEALAAGLIEKGCYEKAFPAAVAAEKP
jgi:phosphatidate phosphatase APP1